MLGKLMGFTAPTAVLSLSVSSMKEIVTLLNNATDKDTLRYFSFELEMLENFLTKTVRYAYANSEDRKLSRKVDKTIKFFETNGEEGKKFFELEELEEKKVYLDSCVKDVSNSIRIGDNYTTLTDNEISVIKGMMQYLRKIQALKNSIVIEDVQDMQAFGFPLYRLKTLSEMKFNSIIVPEYRRLSSMKNASSIRQKLSSWKSDLELLKSRIVDESEEIVSSVTGDKTFNEATYLALTTKGSLNSSEQEVGSILKDNGLLYDYNIPKLKALTKIFSEGCKLTTEYYNTIFGLNLTDDEYDSLFISLLDKGLVGLNRYYKELFKDSLLTLSLSSEKRVVISNKDITLMKFMHEVEIFIDSFRVVGEEL